MKTKEQKVISANTLLADAVFRPILFSTPMVRAIINGKKTQTRRIVKPQPNGSDVSKIGGTKNYSIFKKDDVTQIKSKFNKGDILWVRETWHPKRHNFPIGLPYEYKESALEDGNLTDENWKPSLFMPKDACRLFLEVIDCKIEKLNSISSEDAEKEGIEHLGGDIWKDYLNKKSFPEFMQGSTFTRTHSFQTLWQSINGAQSWDDNPFVWVISFKVVECPYGFR